jgi:hypothetical protein
LFFFVYFFFFFVLTFFSFAFFCSNNLYFPSLDPSLALGSHSTVILFFRSWLSSFGDSSGGFFYFYFFSLKLSSEFFLCFFLFFLEYCHLCGGTFWGLYLVWWCPLTFTRALERDLLYLYRSRTNVAVPLGLPGKWGRLNSGLSIRYLTLASKVIPPSNYL